MAVKKSKAKRKSAVSKRKSAGRSKKMAHKAGARKVAAKAVAAKPIPSIKNRLSKTEMTRMIAGATCLSNKEVSSVFECLKEVIEKSVGGAGQFVMPGIMKINVKRVKAKPARRGVNPFTGEEMMFKAKPAHKKVKISALKALKDVVA